MNETLAIIAVLAIIIAAAVMLITATGMRSKLEELRREFDRSVAGLGPEIRDELRKERDEADKRNSGLRQEITNLTTQMSGQLVDTLRAVGDSQHNRLQAMSEEIRQLTENTAEQLSTVASTLRQELENIRGTVDEQLQQTLETRIRNSFDLVSQRLEAVQRGLGEMQNLAAEVGGLQRLLTNVKVRGTWGEVQLGGILEQILSPSQFARNVKVKPDSDHIVEFAVRLPGRDTESCVWLPIDAKFPQEDYLRLQEAAEAGDPEQLRAATQALAAAINFAANDISQKYIAPPHTVDFAIMFLPTEGLYAEVLRMTELTERIRRKHSIIVAGPTTIAALLSSLRLGFQTLAIERRTAEVWNLLGAVKAEFKKYGDLMDKAKKQLDAAARTIDNTGARTRAIERCLRDVQELPDSDATRILKFGNASGDLPGNGDF